MAKWKAGNYMGSGKSKEQYLGKSRSSGYKAPSKTYKKSTPKLTTPRDPYSGMDWGTAAARAKSRGVDISTGSDFDMMMNKKYNKENYYRMGGGEAEDQSLESYSPGKRASYIESQKPENRRAAAAEASKSPSIGNKIFNTLTGTKTANASSGDRPAPKVTTPTVKTGLGRGLEILLDPLGLRPKVAGLFGADTPQMPDFGITESLGLEKYLKKPGGLTYVEDQPYIESYRKTQEPGYNPYAPTQENADIQNTIERHNDFMTNLQDETRGGRSDENNAPEFDESVSDEMNANDYNLGGYSGMGDQGYGQYNPNGSFIPASQFQIPDNTPEQQDNMGTVPRTYGAGAFGTGKGISNMGMDDETKAYIKQLRKSAGGDYGMSDAKKQIENLLNSLNLQYGEEERLGKNTLDKSLFQNLLGLGGRFNQANTGDSEQRMQYEQLARSENQNSLGEFLARLASSKSQDVLQTKNKGLDLFSQIADKKRTAQQNLLDYIQKIKERQEDMALKWYTAKKEGGSKGAGSVTFLGNDTNGNPVYRNNQTGQREVGTGLTRPSASLTPQLKQDENGNWYYDQE